MRVMVYVVRAGQSLLLLKELEMIFSVPLEC